MSGTRSKVRVIEFTPEQANGIGKLIPDDAQKGDLFLFHEVRKDLRIGSVVLIAMGEQKGHGPLAGVPVISPPVPALISSPVTAAFGSLVVDLLERVAALEARTGMTAEAARRLVAPS